MIPGNSLFCLVGDKLVVLEGGKVAICRACRSSLRERPAPSETMVARPAASDGNALGVLEPDPTMRCPACGATTAEEVLVLSTRPLAGCAEAVSALHPPKGLRSASGKLTQQGPADARGGPADVTVGQGVTNA